MTYRSSLPSIGAALLQGPGPSLEHVDMRPGMVEDGSQTLFGDIISAIRRSRISLAVWLLLCIIAVGIFLVRTTPQFAATAQIVLVARQPLGSSSDPASMMASPALDSAQADSQVQVIRSERNLRYVFDTLNLQQSDDYKPGPPDLISRLLAPITSLFPSRPISAEDAARAAVDQAFQSFSDTVTVRRLGQSYLLEVAVRARSADVARRLANAVSMSYIRDLVIYGAASTQRSTDFLQGRIANLQAEKEAATLGIRSGTIPDFQFSDADARVVSAAMTPLTKAYPQTTIVLAVAVIFAAMTGVGFVTVRQAFDRTIRSRGQIARALGVDCLGAFPLIRGRALQRRDRVALSFFLAIEQPEGEFARCLRVLRTALFPAVDGAHRLAIGVVSCVPGEGRTTIAANLATVLAVGREGVVLIDADLRNPAATRQLMPKAETGLNEVLMSQSGPRTWPETALSPDLSFVPASAAGQVGDPNVYLGSSDMRDMMEDLTRRRDVVVDLPPLSVSSDAQAIGRLLSGVILVTAVNRTSIDQLAEALRALHAGGVRVLGIVLNKVEGKS